ncbi:nitroreductase family protein [Mangrovibacterium diazotrophicum]|uniref:Nitroreductase n=1 Tax=Mangrovibacterium diazotrophicum TaxID=1261403 RepID=A0A419VX55_9BACT|nr:nitroreductase family protein [Mangrovibacterium diazotrophicum]RKD87813.1 nitroreductase [Mangrovibacterium diazotrophicum]
MKTIFDHRSIRKYQSTPISEELLSKILDAGTRASTTGNMQLYSVVVTRDEANKSKLAPLHFNQPMVKEAPVLLTICADLNRFNRWCELRNADAGYDNFLWILNAFIDASLFAQNICLAAESEGLGICYLGTALYNAPEISQALGLPKGVIPVTAITVGYPDHNPPLTDRLPLDAVVHYESYNANTDERVNKLFAEKEALESSAKFVVENNKENLAQVFTDVRYKKADNIYFSEKLTTFLKEQGFEI